MTPPLMIFAAGFGTRMGTLTRDRPKPLVALAGRALIDHAIAMAHAAGIRTIVANAHYRAGMLERHLDGSGVAVSRESPDILDTGGGLRQALPLLGARRVFTLNPDVAWIGPNPLSALARHWRDGMGALMLLAEPPRIHGRDGPGDFSMDDEGRLRRGGPLVYTGAQLIDTAALDGMAGGAFPIGRVWDALAAEGRLHGIVHPGHWIDAGHPDGLRTAAEMLAGV